MEAAFGGTLSGHYRLNQSFALVGLSATKIIDNSYYDKCTSNICPTDLGAVAFSGELHPLDRLHIPVLDPWIGARVGPAWTKGNARFDTSSPEAKARFGAQLELDAGLDLDVFYAALGIGIRWGTIVGATYRAPFVRVELRL